MVSKKKKRKIIYQDKVFYWFVRRNAEGIPRIHLLSEDKKIRLERPLFDCEVPVGSLYIRQLLQEYFAQKAQGCIDDTGQKC